MLGAQNFTALIGELQGELKQQRAEGDAPWRTRAHDLAVRLIKAPQEFLDWAKRDRHWSFTLAEVMRESHSRSSEVAARLAVAMLEELEDEREMRESEGPTDAELAPAAVPAYAE